jgi:hypothetical protein
MTDILRHSVLCSYLRVQALRHQSVEVGIHRMKRVTRTWCLGGECAELHLHIAIHSVSIV